MSFMAPPRDSSLALLEQRNARSELILDRADQHVARLRQMGEELRLRVAEVRGHLVILEVDLADASQDFRRGAQQGLVLAALDVHLQKVQGAQVEVVEGGL